MRRGSTRVRFDRDTHEIERLQRMSVTTQSLHGVSRIASPTTLLAAALAPIAIGGLVALRAGQPTPLFAVPAIAFGVVSATAPALYIASAATGPAPSIRQTARAIAIALGAFGIALAGFVVPAAFLALTSVWPPATPLVASAALAGAGAIALARLGRELRACEVAGRAPARSRVVFAVWAIATLGIAARLWLELVAGVWS